MQSSAFSTVGLVTEQMLKAIKTSDSFNGSLEPLGRFFMIGSKRFGGSNLIRSGIWAISLIAFKTEPAQSGVEIYEHFNSEEALVMKTGVNQAINKEVQVRNNSNYNSLIRVKLTPIVTDSSDNEINTLSQYVKYTYSKNVSLDGSNTAVRTWVKDGEYYYYIGNIAPGYYTDKIL